MTVLRKAQASSTKTIVVIPSGHCISELIIENQTSNIVTGGINIGTSMGGSQVISALPVLSDHLMAVAEADISKKIFSISESTILYIDAVTDWNNAVVNFYFVLNKIK